ncbi:hypothetical protein BGZ99_004806 [Dissophora globulifera]|uniref:F-box domain-containing protein n=1 Tax=Dissophora globulifera TaxID=979702 RepID=A0A9P6RL59_9FUNG|nr:hypothetical protein BGZ99_004806 [Dissophora globulifera]
MREFITFDPTETGMRVINPLELPEIVLTLGRFLYKSDLVSCILVCKLWHAAFIQSVWFTLAPRSPRRHDPPYSDLEVLKRHRDLVHDIVYNFGVTPELAAIQFPALLTLTLRGGGQALAPTLVAQHSQLTGLTLSCDDRQEPPKALWAPAARLHSLTSLKISGFRISEDECADFWRLCRQLTELHLHVMDIATSPFLESDIDGNEKGDEESENSKVWAGTEMQTLSIASLCGFPLEQQWEIAVRCRNLKVLAWTHESARLYWLHPDLSSSGLAMASWPQTHKLTLMVNLSDEQLAFIFDSAQRITQLKLAGVDFGSKSLAAIKRHFPWLQTFAFTPTSDTTALMAAQILKGASTLVQFRGGKVNVQSWIQESQPKYQLWACKDTLRILQLSFNLARTGIQRRREHEYVFERLSELTKLEDLDVSSEAFGEGTLDFRLGLGLGRLATLTQLRTFVFFGTEQRMRLAEVEWMIKHWKKLKKVMGLLSDDWEVEDMLRARFKAAGIHIPP